MVDAAAYVSALSNQPWVQDGLHCWRLVRDVQRDLFGRDLPPVLTTAPGCGLAGARERIRLFGAHAENAHWREVDGPVHGAIAKLARRGVAWGPEHAGVWLDLDGGGVLHTDAPHGVVFDTLPQLATRGWVPSWFVPID